MEDLLHFNGIDAVSGEYLLPPIEPGRFARVIEKSELDSKEVAELKQWYFAKTQAHLGLKEGDPIDLAQAGWGVIFPAGGDPTIREALKELIDWRREQASRTHSHYFREFRGADGYRPGESKLAWLARHGMGPGPADPAKVPYYLLIVGDPETIPYRFQSQLDVQYAVGRVHFDDLASYAQYAHSVVEAERRQLSLPRRMTFFGVSNSDDPATQLSARELVEPLSAFSAQKFGDWQVQNIPPVDTTKARLSRLLGGPETPALLFSASHGMSFPNGHPLQFPHQGALLTQDWPGPRQHQGPINGDYYFSGTDLGDDANVFGLLAFLFACFGAGTPLQDDFAQAAFKDQRVQIAPRPFLAALPTRLLSHPRGAALAVIGHVDRAWSYSFNWGNARRQLAVFESALSLLLKGYPVGAAIDPFNLRYAELSAELSALLEDIEFGKRYDPRELSGLWTANNDARNYMILGDPAVRLMAALPGQAAAESRPYLDSQPVIEPSPKIVRDAQLTQMIHVTDLAPPRQAAGRLFSLARNQGIPLPERRDILLGRRDPDKDILPDIDLSSEGETSPSVSRRHARLLVEGNQVYLEDLNSRNHTFHNGQRLQPGEKSLLKNGDLLQLGGVFLIYLAY